MKNGTCNKKLTYHFILRYLEKYFKSILRSKKWIELNSGHEESGIEQKSSHHHAGISKTRLHV